MHVMPAKGLQHEKCGDIRPFFYVLMDILSRISSVRDVSWVCYAYMWFYDLRKVEHWIALCSLVQRPNRDQGVNHPEPRQMTLLMRWVWIYLCFEIDQWLEVLWCSMEHNFQCCLAATVEMSSIQYGWSFLIIVSPQHCFSECAIHWEFNDGSLRVWERMSFKVQRTVSLHTLSLSVLQTRAHIFPGVFQLVQG